MKNQTNRAGHLVGLILILAGFIGFANPLNRGAVAVPQNEGGSLHFVGVTTTGGLWHTIRRADGTWTQFGDVKGQAGNPGTVVDADVAVVGNSQDYVLHLCAVSADGHLWHTIRKANGTWTAFGDVEGKAGDRGSFVAIAMTEIVGELHVVGVTSDGKLWHTIRKEDGTWLPFGDVKGQAGERGRFLRVGIASTGELHVSGVTSEGKVWHTIRRRDGSWLPFGDVIAQAGSRGSFKDTNCVALGLELHLSGVTADGRLWHTVRRENGSWTPFGDVEGQAGDRGSFVRVSLAQNPTVGEIHLSGVTSDGKLWHTIRKADGSWTPFGDVKVQAGDRGSFNAVATDLVQDVIR